jgi:hypothetical protein
VEAVVAYFKRLSADIQEYHEDFNHDTRFFGRVANPELPYYEDGVIVSQSVAGMCTLAPDVGDELYNMWYSLKIFHARNEIKKFSLHNL